MEEQTRYPPVKVPESDMKFIPLPCGGHRRLVFVEGLYLSATDIETGFIPDGRKNVYDIQDMSCRHDDVQICAFPKAGTHWIWEITTMLLKGKPEYSESSKVSAMMEFNTPAELDKLPSPRVLNHHLPYHLVPMDGKMKGVKLLFIQRNPKDIAVSFYNMLKQAKYPFPGSFSDWLQVFLFQQVYPMNWFDYTLHWEKVIKEEPDLNLHIIYYENLHKDPIGEITRLSQFLGTSTDQDLITQIAEKCSFTNMKKANVEVKDLSPLKFEQRLFETMYRTGEIGNWKHWFTVAENELFDHIYNKSMKDSSFSYKFTS